MTESGRGRLGCTLAIALLGIVIAACTPSPAPTSAATTTLATTAVDSATTSSPPISTAVVESGTTTSGGLAAELISSGRVIICMTFPVPRVAEFDASGEPTGQSVEFALELAGRLNLEPEIRDTIFEDIIGAIEEGDCDFSLAGHIITPERLERIEMIPYLKGQLQIVIRHGNPDGLIDLEDLCGQAVATRSGTIQEDLVRGEGLYVDSGLQQACAEADLPPIDLVTFPGEEEAVDLLRQGEVVAFLGSTTWLVEYPDELALAATVALPDYTNGIGVHKDHPLLADALRSSMDAMIADGTYARIHSTWGIGQPLSS